MMTRLAIGIAAVFITTAAAQAQCPQVGTARQQFKINEGFSPDPSRHGITAGGNLDLGRCSGVPGKGWVTQFPDFIVMYQASSGKRSEATLTFTTESSIDTILLINDPNNRWHWNDDGGEGLNGKIRFPKALSGRYDVWVGTFDKGNFTKVRLLVTELD